MKRQIETNSTIANYFYIPALFWIAWNVTKFKFIKYATIGLSLILITSLILNFFILLSSIFLGKNKPKINANSPIFSNPNKK